MREMAFSVTGMKCGGCVAKAQEAIKKVPGVTDVQVDLAGKSAVVKGTAEPEQIIEALKRVGYPATLEE